MNAAPHASDEGGVPRRLSRLGVPIAALGFVAIEFLCAGTSMTLNARHTLAVTVATALCWVLEAMPLGSASLIPLALFPLLGVLSASKCASTYFDDVNFLFLGGMILGAGVERWGLHRRIALSVVSWIGTSPRRIVLGFLVGTAFVSLWISNTATAVMMYPIALAVVETADLDRNDAGSRNFATAVLLVVAYGSNIGGIGTPIGTGPNLVMLGQFAHGRALGDFAAPSFLGWMAGMVPIVAVTCLVAWWLVTRVVIRVPARIEKLEDTFRARVGRTPWTQPEIRIGVVFLAAIVLWIGRTLKIDGVEYGWLRFFPESLVPGEKLDDVITNTTVAVVFALIAFCVPAGNGTDHRLVDAHAIRRVPWDMLLLLGAGSAIATAFKDSHLSEWLGEAMSGVTGGWSAIWIVAGLSLLVTFLSEVTSNTATASVMLPLAAVVGRSAGIDPRMPALAVTLGASLAFMLPIGTPPNMIVFSSGRIPLNKMLAAGFLLNLVCVALGTAAIFLFTGRAMGVGVR